MNIKDNNAFLMAMGDGSRIEIHAYDAKKDSWTQITQTVTVGEGQPKVNTLTLAENTGWEIGDIIVIAASGRDMEEAEERTITDVNVDENGVMTITLDAPLQYTHLGEIRTFDNGLTGEDFQSWEVDMRAEVALLSRNVTIQGDADSAEDGYGGHIMVMQDVDPETPGASMHIDGAEFTHMGQEGIVGRYPLHWHMLGDASGQYITNTSIHHTFNKGMTIHGTQNTWVENVAIHDTIGHTYYFEDGSEFGNVLLNTLGMTTRAFDDENMTPPIGSDVTEVSTYWVTNPANHMIDNHSAGSEDTGFWILSQNLVQGTSLASGLYDGYAPLAEVPGQWIGNSSHSNGDDGMWIGSEFDETDGSKSDEPRLLEPFKLFDFTTYSNDGWGIWQRNGNGDFEQLKIVESEAGIQLWGSSRVENSLFVGRSDNGDTPLEQYVGWQLYDNPAQFSNVHFEGYTGENDAAISNGWGFGRSVIHSAKGLTFAEDGTEANAYRYTLNNDGAQFINRKTEEGDAIAGGVIDLDGSLTGTPGAIVTPGIVDFHADRYVDVLTYADPAIEAAGFNETAGAVWDPETQTWTHQPGTIIGKMVVFQQTRDELGNLTDVTGDYVPDRVTYTIERSDNGAKIEVNPDSMVTYAWHMQYNLDTSDGVEYIFDYSAETPDAVNFELTELPEGATAYYRFKGLPDGVVFQKADAAESMAEFEAATVTTWIREPGGDYLVKAVAEIIDYREPIRSTDDLATERVYTDDFTLIVKPIAGEEPSGNWPWQRDLKIFEEAAPLPLPEKAESTSSTVEITPDMARWSDAASWDGDVPGVDEIVIIGPGRTVVMDTFVKVGAILINGGELLVEDTKDLQLAADWILVVNGGLFQVGTEDSPFVHDFELTLEGDNQDNDVDVMALMASADDNIVRAIENDPATGPETTQRVVADVDDTRSWDYRKVTYDAAGDRIANEYVFDDGRVSTTTYVGGVRAAKRDVDAEDSMIWDQFLTSFDSDGNRTEFKQIFDDGRVTTTKFVNGAQSERVVTDGGNTKAWETIKTTYAETGELLQFQQTFDDGRLMTQDYENGVRAVKHVADLGGAYGWSESKTTYDVNGNIKTFEQTFDDGREEVVNFAGGVRSTRLLTDAQNQKSWETIAADYDGDGKPASVVVTYDDLRVSTTSYENGKRTSVQVQDTDNRYSFDTVTMSFAKNGSKLETVRILDTGEEQVIQHITLKQAINIDGGEFTAVNGLVYDADETGVGIGFSPNFEIAGTENDGLYTSQRYNFGELAYEFGVDSGSYLLELNFAETFEGASQPGQRVIDIFVEDKLVFKDFDIADEAGFITAIDLLGRVEVQDGSLSLRMVGVENNPSLAGLSIWNADGTGPSDWVVASVSDEFNFL